MTRYARAVANRKIIAGPHVRDACARHLKDLEHGPSRGLFFDRTAAARVLGFFQDVLRLNGGEYEGIPYQPLGWQAFILGSLFGWIGPDGYRRFRVAYIETGKGSGKSPLAAGIGLYGMMADGEQRAEIYAAATKKDQAMILFRDAVAMVDQSPPLRARVHKSGVGSSTWNLAHLPTGSFFRPISADDGQSGPRPHIALLDEIHEHRNGNVVEMLRAGTKNRRQALIVMITNSGAGQHSYCWERHDHAVKVAAGQIDDDSLFSYVCALDEDDDPMHSEACWDKANPSLRAGLPGLKYLREQVTEARGMPGKESIVRRLNFCQWVESESPWISRDVWFGAQDDEFPADGLLGRRCWGGLDLSSAQDLTALVLLFEPSEIDPQWRLVSHFWLPNDGLHDKGQRDRVPYISWRDAGHLHTTPGRAIDQLYVAQQAAELASMYEVQTIAYDRWHIESFKQMLDREGISLPLEPFGQGYKDMAPAVNEFERRLLGGQLKHGGNRVMTWCAANAVIVSDPAGNRKMAKDKASGRIDGIVAAIMAAGSSMVAMESTAVGMEVW